MFLASLSDSDYPISQFFTFTYRCTLTCTRLLYSQRSVHSVYSTALSHMNDQLTDIQYTVIYAHLLPQSSLSYLTHAAMTVMSRSVSVAKSVRFVKTLCHGEPQNHVSPFAPKASIAAIYTICCEHAIYHYLNNCVP